MENKNFIRRIMFLLLWLLLSYNFALAYNLNEIFGNEEHTNKFLKDSLVSAEGINPQEFVNAIQNFMEQEENRVNTCVKSIDGSFCQQMIGAACESSCESGCVEKLREEVDECVLGTCIDKEEGICSPRTPKILCDEELGNFDEREIESVPECQKKCCIIGSEARFVTEGQCNTLGERYGTDVEFNEEIISEPDCLLLSVGQAEGACVLEQAEGDSEKHRCVRSTLSECNGYGGDFNEAMLCSNSELQTICTSKNYTSCVEGKDEVYWFDSCGNMENIYGSEVSGKDGVFLTKEESCVMGRSGDWLQNQDSCGNCNRLLSSKCGNETSEQELDDSPDGDAVCLDLGCDVDGERKENGESWCNYQDAIGTSLEAPLVGGLGYFAGFHVPGLRSMSAPGGRHFRQSCIDGKIITEPCSDYRNEVCTQSLSEEDSDSFSIAACRPNEWPQCLNYNSNGGGPLSDMISQIQPIAQIIPAAGRILEVPLQNEKIKVGNLMLQCESNPDCYVNSMSVGKDYKFPLCLPKYPPGFYSHDAEGEDESICSYANQRCVSVWVFESTSFTFGATAEWKCKAGCDCVEGSPPATASGSWNNIKPSSNLVKQSHDMCVSLGDCGNKANYKGEGGIEILEGFFGSEGYTLKIRDYDGLPKEDPDEDARRVSGPSPGRVDDSNPIDDKYIDSDYEGLFGTFDEGSGGEEGGVGPESPSFEPADPTNAFFALGGITGASALGAAAAVKAATIPASQSWILFETPTESSYVLSQTYEAVMSPTLVALKAATMGAAIGATVVSLLVGFSGIGGGVGVGGSIAYGVGGAVSGAMIGTSVAASSASSAVASGTYTAAQSSLAAWATGHTQFLGVIKVLGPVIMIIVIADIIAQWLAGVGEIKTVEAIFECNLWQPPSGSEESCESCGEDGLPCSKYSCETLGKNCEFILESEGLEENEDSNLCIYNPEKDVSAPKIVDVLEEPLTDGFNYYDKNLGNPKSSFKIEKASADDGCANQLEAFTFGFEIDEHGECRFSFEPDSDFETMTQFGDRLVSKQHVHTLSLKNVPFEGNETKEVVMYVKCADYSSTEEGRNLGEDNDVTFCINPVDLTAPVVVDEIENIFVSHETEEHTIRVEFNEEIENARLGTEDKPFEELEYEMICNGRVCYFDVPLELGENDFYIRAEDFEGNRNEQGILITVTRAESELVILSVSPNGEILESGGSATSIELETQTSGGFDGTATCSYKLNGRNGGYMEETGIGEKSLHKQSLNQLTGGNYGFEVFCVDAAGNTASAEGSFEVLIDSSYPKVTRVYNDGGTLVVVTDESAECAFVKRNAGDSKVGCGFSFESAEKMFSSGFELKHTTGLDKSFEYLIKCRDNFGNSGGGCSIIVARGEL